MTTTWETADDIVKYLAGGGRVCFPAGTPLLGEPHHDRDGYTSFAVARPGGAGADIELISFPTAEVAQLVRRVRVTEEERARVDEAIADDAAACAALIERHGWMRGDFWPGAMSGATTAEGWHIERAPWAGGPTCAIGAIAVVTDVDPGELYERSARGRSARLHNAMRSRLGLLGSIDVWNDVEGRTAGEVVAAFRAVEAAHRPGTDGGRS